MCWSHLVSAALRAAPLLGNVPVLAQAEEHIELYTKMGFGDLPICMAKTQYSFSADASAKGAPSGFTLPIRCADMNYLVKHRAAMLWRCLMPSCAERMSQQSLLLQGSQSECWGRLHLPAYRRHDGKCGSLCGLPAC